MIKIFMEEGVVDGEGGSSERCLKWGGGDINPIQARLILSFKARRGLYVVSRKTQRSDSKLRLLILWSQEPVKLAQMKLDLSLIILISRDHGCQIWKIFNFTWFPNKF